MIYVAFQGTRRLDAILFSDILYFSINLSDLGFLKRHRIFIITLVDAVGHSLEESIILFIPKNHSSGGYFNLYLLNLTYKRQ